MISNSYILTGLSSDTKPTPSIDGSLFIENDTAFMYTSLAGAWVLKTTGSNLSLTDITNNDTNTTRHGFFPKLPSPTGKLLKDNLVWVNSTLYNQSVTSQVGFAVDTYLAGSANTIPAGSLKV